MGAHAGQPTSSATRVATQAPSCNSSGHSITRCRRLGPNKVSADTRLLHTSCGADGRGRGALLAARAAGSPLWLAFCPALQAAPSSGGPRGCSRKRRRAPQQKHSAAAGPGESHGESPPRQLALACRTSGPKGEPPASPIAATASSSRVAVRVSLQTARARGMSQATKPSVRSCSRGGTQQGGMRRCKRVANREERGLGPLHGRHQGVRGSNAAALTRMCGSGSVSDSSTDSHREPAVREAAAQRRHTSAARALHWGQRC